ncbi:hypothetical protein JCM12298_04340 [Desulfothermus naphthae]
MKTKYEQWDNKHVLLYVSIGFIFILLLSVSILIKEPIELKNIARNLAISIGPVWMLGLLYQHFLFKEIREAASEASAEALLNQAQPLIDNIRKSAQEVQTEVANMMHLRELGIERGFKKRKDALPLVCEWLRAEKQEIAFVGTSLRGLFWDELGDSESEVGQVLKERLQENPRTCRFKFLLTHPAFSHLRQDLERLHRPEDFQIKMEIRESVKRLLNMGAKPEEIHFVKATPTCFAIKTSSHMLINPYPLENQALASFCLIVGNTEGRNSIYSSFEQNHFIFDSANCEKLGGPDDEDIDRVFNQTLDDVLKRKRTDN